MRIEYFRIENFRNLRFVECEAVPDFMVLCGGNGCGKSALLEALMTAKERAGAYGNFPFDPRAVTANAPKATIEMELSFSEAERNFIQERYQENCPEQDKIVIEILRGGEGRPVKRSNSAARLLSYFSRGPGSPGFFDYVDAHRMIRKSQLSTWDTTFLSDDRAKNTLASSEQKYQMTKQYLAALEMRDLQELGRSLQAGNPVVVDSLKEIRDFFDRFFAPMQFKGVNIHESPFSFVISTP